MIYHEVIVTDDFFLVPWLLSFGLAHLFKGTANPSVVRRPLREKNAAGDTAEARAGWCRQFRLCVAVWWHWEGTAATEAGPAAGETAACPQTHSLTRNSRFLTHGGNLLLWEQGSNPLSGGCLGVTRFYFCVLVPGLLGWPRGCHIHSSFGR